MAHTHTRARSHTQTGVCVFFVYSVSHTLLYLVRSHGQLNSYQNVQPKSEGELSNEGSSALVSTVNSISEFLIYSPLIYIDTLILIRKSEPTPSCCTWPDKIRRKLTAWSRCLVRCVFLSKNCGPYTKQPELKISKDNNVKKPSFKNLLINVRYWARS